MEPSELLRIVAEVLDRLGVRYAVVGSMASMLYGEPRLTNDVDIVVDLRAEQVEAFCAAFPGPEYYLSRQAVESAVMKRSQFNIIHPASGLKADCILPADDAFSESELRRAVRIAREYPAYAATVATPEDVIVKKLEYFRLGESEKHIRDICGILRMRGERIDREYIRQWPSG